MSVKVTMALRDGAPPAANMTQSVLHQLERDSQLDTCNDEKRDHASTNRSVALRQRDRDRRRRTGCKRSDKKQRNFTAAVWPAPMTHPIANETMVAIAASQTSLARVVRNVVASAPSPRPKPDEIASNAMTSVSTVLHLCAWICTQLRAQPNPVWAK